MSRPAGTRPPSSSIPDQNATGSNHTGVPRRTDTCSVVIFGEAGAGKSSLVNLIAGTNMAVTASSVVGCTTRTNEHEILIQNEMLKVKLFDTPGLDEGPRGTIPDEEARRILEKLIQTLMKQGDIHLIVYCVRGERAIRGLRRNYDLIHSRVQGKVPIVLVVTGLESYKPDMEEWWRVKERTISNVGMTFAGHACITTAMMTRSDVMERRNQSYDAVCKLIEQCRLSVCRKNIVLFGQVGGGKSSLVNLMAGKDVAKISSDLKPCTLCWQEYPIEFDGESYKVFDTVGLNETQLGIPQFLNTVENAYRLIEELDRQGGIDLLLFCVRVGRLTPILQRNYRLFHEFLCDKKVPIVMVITHLENEVGEMDDWWKRNETNLRDQEVHVTSHACITAIRGKFPHLYEESRGTIRNLVKKFTADGQKEAWNGGGGRFVSFTRKLRESLVGNGKPMRKNMVSRLTKRCGMSPDVAQQLANMIKNEVEGAT
ncbi:P-loop containing nucleoside triphosphate hydrolase protein [Suillus lakei]|nr:P-loop containing nucleoside triphosphate hydrolase protein [Suillus lakei]